jgi:hypothetical protein
MVDCGFWRDDRSRRPKGADRLRWWRRDPTRRRQRDECCRTRRGRRRPVGYDMLPGQLANRWAVEVGKWLVVDDTEMGCDGRRWFFDDG